jgi:hypothetical protein
VRLEDMYRLEYQRRPYTWVEFRNVSLEPGHETDVDAAVLKAKDELARGLPVSEQDKNSLGYILYRLSENLHFPAKGRAIYQIEEWNAQSQEPRQLRCEYVFDGVLYGFSVKGEKPGDLNVRRFFDGKKTIRYRVRDNVATIYEDMRQMTPIYRLQQFFPSDIIKDLLSHKVELKDTGEINRIPCWLLESVMSYNDRLKVWVTKVPDVYPLLIERYEYENLRYLYEAKNIKSWNGVLLPEKTTISTYRSDEALHHSLSSRRIVTVESFVPNIEISSAAFQPDFEPDTTMSSRPVKSKASDFVPKRPAKRLRQLADINIEFDIAHAKDKSILICFFDMNQRPSRNCLIELAKRVGELNEKDIVIVAVHTSKVDETKLNEWVKSHTFSFPVGTVKGNEKKFLFDWGIQSLPWLILTDKQHTIVAEGFGIDELDDKI